MTQPSPPGSSLGLLDRLLSYVDAPWKVGAVIAMAITGTVLWVLWTERAQVAEAVLQRTVHPHLEVDKFPDIAKRLLEATGTEVAALVAVQLENNLSHTVAGVRRSDPAWQPSQAARPVWIGNDTIVEIVALIEGNVVCFDLGANEEREGRREMAALGLRRMCGVAVPSISNVMVGALFLGWKEPPSRDVEAAARSAMRKAALQLAEW